MASDIPASGAEPATGGTQGAVASGSRRKRQSFDRSIVDGPIVPAVWKIAWPTVLQNAIGGLQGIVDHALVGHYVGYTANTAIGVSWQIFLVVIVFISSLFTRDGRARREGRGGQRSREGHRTCIRPFSRPWRCRLAFLSAPSATCSRRRFSTLVERHARRRAEACRFSADDVSGQHRAC